MGERQPERAVRQLAETQIARTAIASIKARKESYLSNGSTTIVRTLFLLRTKQYEKVTAPALQALLFRMNKDLHLVHADEWACTLRFETPNFILPRLPQHYAYKGGAARYFLLRCLFPEHGVKKPRDLDLVRFVRGDCETDNALAKMYMPEDLQHGFGVEEAATRAEYFGTRDLTVNELLVEGDTIHCSLRCLCDLLSGQGQVTEHISIQGHRAAAKATLKLLRLESELLHQGFLFKASLPESFSPSHCQKSDIQRELDRALQRGRKVAERFFRRLQALEIIDSAVQHIGDYRPSSFTRKARMTSR